EAPVEEAAAEEAPAEETASEDSGEPFHFYLGVDKAEITLALSDDALETAFGSDELESSMYRIRAGMRLLDAVGLELQYGVADDKDDGAKKFEVGEYYGIFVVPTGSLFELVEISVPIGYSSMKAERGAASETFDGVSYGVNLEVPITLNSEWFPDIRIGGGGLVYRADRDSRVYGYHFGVRLDFKI
ncbi:MAG TPA: outer membrane beta-barrel protein, partial [Solimonas sp.]